jgi:nicotinamide-nucleotide adenylyltransferase
MKNVLFVGRFQPFHRGHLDAVRQILSDSDFANLIIAIGSGENDFTTKNPLTAGERFELILRTLRAESIPTEKIFIAPIRDVNRNSIWVRHLEKILPPFSTVFSGCEFVRHLFEHEEKFAVKKITKNVPICASEIRNQFLTGKNPEEFLPFSVAEFLREINFTDRLKRIAARN